MFVYENNRECSPIKPDPLNGNFVESYDTDGVYRCQKLVYFSNTARCVSESECYYSSIAGINAN